LAITVRLKLNFRQELRSGTRKYRDARPRKGSAQLLVVIGHFRTYFRRPQYG
jgi:hypothetical protein